MERTLFCYRFGSAEFDEARFELRVAGLPVDVERRALAVLAYLLQHAGEVVTKDELLREVWAGRITVDKVLPNAINKLRRALGEGNAAHITTQARIGYRLDGLVTRTAVGRPVASQLSLAAGQPVPARPSFLLQRQLGRSNGGEVWLAEHPKTRELRVYKFALDAARLRALKREVTLLRVLREGLADASHVVEVLDWNFEAAPFFLECRYAGPSLTEWSGQHLSALDAPARIALFLQIADAVAAAHAVGVLHKDLKPANVLVDGDAGQPHVRLTDFGSGHLLEPDHLEQLGITRLGLTIEDRDGTDSASGTPLYIAPELFDGRAPTVRSDVYALGILLYQLLSGRIGQPMASGWEVEIADELLRDDLRLATDGNPERRLATAAELAERLRRLDPRRAAIDEQRHAQEAARRDREALARAHTRRPLVIALVAALAVGVVAATWLQQRAAAARDEARQELARATALARFVNEDLIGRANPLVSAKGPDATLREVLLSARDRVPVRFRDQPQAAAQIHSSMASLFSAIELSAEAQSEARSALTLLEAHGSASSGAALRARSVLVRTLARGGRQDEAQAQMDTLERLAGESPGALARHELATARSALRIARSDFTGAAVELRSAIDALGTTEPDNTASRDVLRLDLIAVLALSAQHPQALAQGQQLIDEAQARPGDNELLIALARLALARAQGEDHAAAERLLLQARPVIVTRLGVDHTRHLTLLTELLGVAFRRGDWPQAIDYARQVHERARAKFGDDHVTTASTLLNWARALSEAGRAAEAVDKVRVAHEQLQRLLGPTAPRTQDATFVRALIDLDLGRAAQAQPLIDRLDPAVLESYRANGLWSAGVDALRGISLQQRGDVTAARSLLEASLTALKSEEDLAQPSQRSRAQLR
ncbi:MAG: winged helix-turn-helix domain-containing protein [Burkholderiaceae bacterium]|nr:winged helix-turn-helix domain-containing protein [Burkholderiaceae bacterium]